MKNAPVSCGLKVETVGEADTLESAWGLLPAQGDGVVMLADQIRRFQPGERSGLLLEGDVVDGRSTVILRQWGTGWKAWRWVEEPGESHRYQEKVYCSSEPGTTPPHLVYRQYWTRVSDDEVMVWTPVGSRFCGFKEA